MLIYGRTAQCNLIFSAYIMACGVSALVVVQFSHIEVRICVLLAIGSMLNDCSCMMVFGAESFVLQFALQKFRLIYRV